MATLKPARDTGGPAFPRAGFYPDTDGVRGEHLRELMSASTEPQAGMELRDYFAARALPFCCLQHNVPDRGIDQSARLAAEHAYVIADAMLAARKRS